MVHKENCPLSIAKCNCEPDIVERLQERARSIHLKDPLQTMMYITAEDYNELLDWVNKAGGSVRSTVLFTIDKLLLRLKV